jgi:hypothetical protein
MKGTSNKFVTHDQLAKNQTIRVKKTSTLSSGQRRRRDGGGEKIQATSVDLTTMNFYVKETEAGTIESHRQGPRGYRGEVKKIYRGPACSPFRHTIYRIWRKKNGGTHVNSTEKKKKQRRVACTEAQLFF